VRPDEQHALWGIGAWLGGGLSLLVLLKGRYPKTARHSGGAFLIGLYGFGAGMFIGRSVAGGSLALWLQLGVAAGIAVAVTMAAVAVTHLPAWRRTRSTPDSTPTEPRRNAEDRNKTRRRAGILMRHGRGNGRRDRDVSAPHGQRRNRTVNPSRVGGCLARLGLMLRRGFAR